MNSRILVKKETFRYDLVDVVRQALADAATSFNRSGVLLIPEIWLRVQETGKAFPVSDFTDMDALGDG